MEAIQRGKRGLRSLGLVLGILAVAVGGAARASSAQTSSGWALHSGDRVVFYGDSITEQHFYTWWVELYAVTRFPAQTVQFWNAGVGGDRVSGGGGGTIETRLERDVFPHRPTVITVMLGMNDGSYTPLTPAIDRAYRSGYEHILQALQKNAPGSRVLSIGPSPYDEVTRPEPLFPGGYNSSLLHFGEIDRALAATYGAIFTDANRPFTAALKAANSIDARAAQLLVPDRVHPELAAHLMIALAVLDAWHAPALVSRTEIDASAASALPASAGVRVDHVAAKAGGLTWTSLEEALPMPVSSGNAAYALIKQSSPLVQHLNQEPLLVRGLAPGRYRLHIDEHEIATFTAQELAAGVNLAEQQTPMRQQAESVGWTLRDKCDLQFVRERIAIGKLSPEALPALDIAQSRLEESIRQQAAPRSHTFSLTPIS